MPKAVKIILALIGFGLLLVAVFVVDQFIFPFTAKPPYFSDVEAVFNRIQIPGDWEQISSSENRGIRGKRCPIESESACFHKSGQYTYFSYLDTEKLKEILVNAGCVNVSFQDNTPIGQNQNKLSFLCSIDGLRLSGDFDTASKTIYVSVGSN